MGLGRKSIYTSFMAAKSFMSARYTLYLTTCSSEDPESSSTSLRFWRTVRWAVSSDRLRARARDGLTVACLISPVAVWPARKTRPGTLVAGPVLLACLIIIGNKFYAYSCEAWEGICRWR